MFNSFFKTATKATVISAMLASAGIAYAADTTDLTVVLTDAQAGQGPLYLTVQTRDDYKTPKQTAGNIYKDIAGGTLRYTFNDVPNGDYAISLWHDLDSDGQFSMSENYMPADGWGVSAIKDLNRVPTFDDIKVSLSGGSASETIKMHYPK